MASEFAYFQELKEKLTSKECIVLADFAENYTFTIQDEIRSYHWNNNQQIGLEHMSRYVSPVNPAIYPHLTLVLLGIGIFFMAWFFVYEVTSNKLTRYVFKELVISLFAAFFLGFGILFLLLWVGIYV